MCRKFIVRGRVQGVFFRASAQKTAAKLGLTGWVKNLSDGSVESLACGNPAQLEEYSSWLRSGPKLAKVAELEEIDSTCPANSGFEII